MKDTGKTKNIRAVIIFSAVTIIAVIVILVVVLKCGVLSAASMRLTGYEGTVSLSDESGQEITPEENRRLFSGNVLSTEADSKGYVSLDDTKLVTLGELSIASFIKEDKFLTMCIEKGSVFFNVTEKLNDDESFDIATSTMIIGVRGTSGCVITGEKEENLYLLDGDVHVMMTHPKSGKTEEIDLPGGNLLTVIYNEDGTIETEVSELIVASLPTLVLDELNTNGELLERVLAVCDWDGDIVRDIWLLGSPHTAIEATVVDGIVHAAYVSYDEYPEWVWEWISGIVQAAERDDLEEVTAILAENTDKALEIKLDDHFYINGYKVCWSTGFLDDKGTWGKTIYIIPEKEGMGYHVILGDDKLEVYEYCQCADGMYNGDSVRYVPKFDKYVYGHVINGLYDGEQITVWANGMQEVRTYTHGMQISPSEDRSNLWGFGGGRYFSQSELSEGPLEVYRY